MIKIFEYVSANGSRFVFKNYIIEVLSRDVSSNGMASYLLIEHEERYQPCSAEIKIHYAELGGYKCGGYFSGKYEGYRNGVSVTGGAVMLNIAHLRGNRIGTYLFSKIIAWAKQWPDADVDKIKIVEGDAQGDNGIRRNGMYEKAGIVFQYYDEAHSAGSSLPMKSFSLVEARSWKKNIIEIDMESYIIKQLGELESKEREISGLKSTVSYQRNRIDYATENPIKWLFQAIWNNHGAFIIVAIIVIMASVRAYYKLAFGM